MNSPASDTPTPSLWSSLKEAVRGSHDHDFTQGSVGRAILLLAVPMVLEMVMESVFALADVFYVSKVGAEAGATVGIAESMISVVYAVCMGLSIGTMAMVARRAGEKDPERTAQTAVQGILLGIGVSVPLGVVGVLAARPLLSMMGASPWILEHGVRYTQILLGSTPIIMLLFLINAIFRGAGDAAIAMRVLWLANSINIVLGPFLIFGWGPFPELGVTGAALATATGRTAGVCYQLYQLTWGGNRVRIQRRHIALDFQTIGTMLRLSGSATFQTIIGMASWIGLVRIVSTFGSNALAGYTIAMRIVLFALLPSWGLANAAATMVGQSLGAGVPERGEHSVRIAARYNMIFLGSLGVLLIVFADPLIGLFSADPQVASHATRALRIVSSGFLFYANGMVFTQAFNGAGDTTTPTLINLFCFWLLELPLAYSLAVHFQLGPTGAFLSVLAAFSILAVVSALLFKRGTWKARTV